MSNDIHKIECWNCGAEIIEYYDETYKGKRGRCSVCGINFPLD